MAREYNVTYNFGEYQNQIESFFNRLIQKSIQYFAKQVTDKKILKNNSNPDDPVLMAEFNKMCRFVKNTEEYLNYYYVKDKKNFPNIFIAISKLDSISVLNDEDRGIYGITNHDNTIQISPILSGNENLTAEQRTRLYVAHELGHMVNKEWTKQIRIFMNKNDKLNIREKGLFYEGFSLINEATTQDRAEDIAYFYASQQRPGLRFCRDPRGMYSGERYKANYDFYGELQEPAIIFARTLRGIGKIGNDNEAMRALSRRALEPNFVNTVINEYQRDGQINNLYNEMIYMGLIKRASYARFGYDERSFIDSSKETLENLKRIALSLRDYREPFED